MNINSIKRVSKKIISMASLLLIDLFAFYISFFIAYYIRVSLSDVFGLVPVNFHDISKLYWVPFIYIIIFMYEGLYTKRSHFWDEAKHILRIISLSTLLIVSFLSFLRLPYEISRTFIVILWIISMLLFPIFRYYGKKLLYLLKIWDEPILVLGHNKRALDMAGLLETNRYLGYRVVGFMSLDRDMVGKTIRVKDHEYKVVAHIDDYCKNKDTRNVDVVLVAVFGMGSKKFSKLIMNIQQSARRVLILPELDDPSIQNSNFLHMYTKNLYLFEINNNLKVTINYFIKKMFDYSLAILLLPLILPILAIISIFIKLDSKGSIFFIQDRLGHNGKTFKCIKFRTMHENGDEILEEYLANNPEAREEYRVYKKLRTYDPRITRMGAFFRKTSLDEIAQIFNVLKGEMGFVGPRPYLEREREDMGKYADTILQFQPGITGLWQISGRNNLTFKSRVELDAWYVLNWSLWHDIHILLKTIRVIVKRDGAS